jgi:peptidoglycan hydrolase-like protein with peptidoglycan-binding domain
MATSARDIRDIQRIVGAYVDGVYGPQTTAKVKEFQPKIGAYADGVWGPKTEAAYLVYLAAQQPQVDPAVVKAAYDATIKTNARPLSSILQIVGHTGSTFDATAYTKVCAYQKNVLATPVVDGIWGQVTEIAYQHRQASYEAQESGLSVSLVPVVEVARCARDAGFSGSKLVDAVSVAIAESGIYHSKTAEWLCDPIARFVNTGTYSVDRGVWQINDYFHPDVSDYEADSPALAAREVYRISSGGTNFKAWATWNSGTALKRRPAAQAAVDKLLAEG